uniref:Uncharacterized protein LOC102801854 n=1 Tax=Saccoglossus kowalevskii TaxID=10224 RepID=A0ABM0MXD1_SACKO|nr:PREDICTED: uncharacterized protein LOC102801854 [Saccoglossus kowalevskii]
MTWFLFILVLFLSGSCLACYHNRDCSSGKYCDALAGYCLDCSCCCQDQIDRQEFVDKCSEEMKPFQWCFEPKQGSECSCDFTTPALPVSNNISTTHSSSKTSSNTISTQQQSTDTTGTSLNATANATTVPIPIEPIVPSAKSSVQWLKWIGIGIPIIAIVIIACICCNKYKSRNNQGSESTDGQNSEYKILVEQLSDSGIDDQSVPSSSNSQESIQVPADVQTEDEVTQRATPYSDGDEDGSPNHLEDKPAVSGETACVTALPPPNQQLPTQCNILGGINNHKDNELEMSRMDDNKLVSEITEMEGNIDLMDELVFVDVPLCGKNAVDYLVQEFTDINPNRMKTVKHHSGLNDSATKKVFQNMKSKNPQLKCMEIIRFLNHLERNEVVEVIQQYHKECPACQVYYEKIGNLKCKLTVTEMEGNIDLMDELVSLDVPLCGKNAVDYLAQEFTDINPNKMKAVKHYSDLNDSATKKVFLKMKSKNPALKCVEIIRFLQNRLGRNEDILVIQKYHMDCPACQVYYNNIECLSSIPA